MIASGIHQMTADSYHALETPTPALSSSIARKLLGYSPLHAWYAHPALGAGASEEREVFDIGTAAHALILEGDESKVVVVDAKDYKTKAAQEARDTARAAGKVPVIAHRMDDVRRMALTILERLLPHPQPIPLTLGQPEQTLVWREDDLWCKARLDWLRDDRTAIDDLKTGENANPDAWTRGPLFALGYDVQAAWYLRGLKAVTGAEAEFRFVVCETRPPYAVSVIGLGPDVLQLAEKKVRRALDLWRACLETGRWPGYPSRTCYASLPAWQENQWLERELRDEGIRDDGRPIEQLLVEGTK